VDATIGSGIDTAVGGTGVSVYDFNRDGLDDITIARRDASPAIMVNNGDGTFTDIGPSTGVVSMGSILVPIWIDVDRDGDPDLFLGHSGMGGNALWLNNGDLTFTDVSADWGVATRPRVGTAVFGDIDNDGYPDLFMGVDFGPDILYRNVEGTRFEDVSDQYGIRGDDISIPMQATFIDFDFDGDRDLFVTHDEDIVNFFYINDGQPPFTDQAQQYRIQEIGAGNSMGVAWGDPDLDGDFDAYVTRIRVGGLYVYDQRFNRFSDEATAKRVALNGTGWGVVFNDLDNDMDEDLAMVHSTTAGFPPPIVFQNQGPLFDPVFDAGDFTFVLSDLGLASGDFNDDGRVDLIAINSRGEHRLLINETQDTGNWVTIELIEPDSTPAGIGSILRLDVGSHTLMRAIHGGDGYGGQNSYRIHFGLGAETVTGPLRITWANGMEQTFDALEAGKRYQVDSDGMREAIATSVDEPERWTSESAELTVRVWPNPATESVHFDLSSGLLPTTGSVGSWHVMDILGRVIESGTLTRDRQISVSQWPAGLYLLQVEHAGETSTATFIVN